MKKEHLWILASLGVGSFMAALDGSIVNTILPVVQRAFHTDLATIQWVILVYLLVVSGLLLSFGRLGDLKGHRRVCLWGFALFTLGSALCGLAPKVSVLIAVRGVQAIGAGMIFANSPAILTMTFPVKRRGQALGMQATLTYLGLALGPSLGGWIADVLHWRMVFLMNIPLGIAAMAASLRFIPADAPRKHDEPFDRWGAAMFMAGLVLFMLALNQGHDWGWTSPILLATLLASAVLLAAFVATERRVKHPVLDLKLFRGPVFSASVASAMLNYTCVSMVVFLMPFYLIKQLGWNPLQTGLLLSVQPLVMAAAAPISGTISDRLHPWMPATLGMAIMAVGVSWLATLSPQNSWVYMAAGLAVVGLGTGTFISPNNNALMSAAPRHRQGIAAGVLATARNVGMVMGVGLAGAIVTTMMVSRPADRLFEAVRASYWTAASVATLGIAVSAVRKRDVP